ncbi:hypothetical protein GCM10022275_34060 [Tessaracoccus defluvii]
MEVLEGLSGPAGLAVASGVSQHVDRKRRFLRRGPLVWVRQELAPVIGGYCWDEIDIEAFEIVLDADDVARRSQKELLPAQGRSSWGWLWAVWAAGNEGWAALASQAVRRHFEGWAALHWFL